jgi:hypothetical protein
MHQERILNWHRFIIRRVHEEDRRHVRAHPALQ